MVRDGQLSAGHARALLSHPDPLKGAKEVVKQALSVRQTEELVNGLTRQTKPRSRATRQKDADIEALAQNLTERLGLRVNIKFNGKGGSLVLSYTDLDQLDSLLALLNH
jgi:ParB family chromosome partitioning protein